MSKRNTKYVGSGLQKRFIIKTVFIFCLLLLLFSVLLFFLSYHMTYKLENGTQLSNQIIRFGGLFFQAKFLAIILFLMLCAIYMAMSLTHPIAGPLVNIENKLAEIAHGDLTSNITLRANDEINHIADEINNIINDFREVIEASHEEIDQIRLFLDQLPSNCGEAHCGISEENISKLREKIVKLENNIKKYKTLRDTKD
ncbi:methyl-accepting chemotaxis protein [bacterium]|nr:methyl-accepting chemotaxis protein [bacterium]